MTELNSLKSTELSVTLSLTKLMDFFCNVQTLKPTLI